MTESPRRNLVQEGGTRLVDKNSKRVRIITNPANPYQVVEIVRSGSSQRIEPNVRIQTYILLTNRSLFTPLPLLPLGFSVHISFTFSNTMLQCRSNALTRASSFRLLRQEIRTWVCVRVAVCRSERGPAVSSCSSTRATSYSLWDARCTISFMYTLCMHRNVMGSRGESQEDVVRRYCQPRISGD